MTDKSLSPALIAAIAQAVALAMANAKPSKEERVFNKKNGPMPGVSARSVENAKRTAIAFKKLGIKDAIPHQNVKTFNRWMAEGRRPIEGSKAVKVSNLRLFHISQTRLISMEEKAALKAQSDEAISRYMSQPLDSTEGEEGIRELVTDNVTSITG